MKEIYDMSNELQDPDFMDAQFDEQHAYMNILWVAPQLTGKQLYKSLLPYIVLHEQDIANTALTGLHKYNPVKQIDEVDMPINSRQVLWADVIVFPFTKQPLIGIYKEIRRINPDITICYNIDFDFYNLSKYHPFYKIFEEKKTVRYVEDNAFWSDITFVTNTNFAPIFADKIKELRKTEYAGSKKTFDIKMFPFLADKLIIAENINIAPPKVPNNPDKLRVGVLSTNFTWEDINSYKKELAEISAIENVELIVYGVGGTHQSSFRNSLDKIPHEHIKPSTIIHYFKQLYNLNLDLLFIPLKDTEYNRNSENYNKYIEAGMFGVPIAVKNSWPYSEFVEDRKNGFVFEKKADIVSLISELSKNKGLVKEVGAAASRLVDDTFCYHEDNFDVIADLFNYEPTPFEPEKIELKDLEEEEDEGEVGDVEESESEPIKAEKEGKTKPESAPKPKAETSPSAPAKKSKLKRHKPTA